MAYRLVHAKSLCRFVVGIQTSFGSLSFSKASPGLAITRKKGPHGFPIKANPGNVLLAWNHSGRRLRVCVCVGGDMSTLASKTVRSLLGKECDSEPRKMDTDERRLCGRKMKVNVCVTPFGLRRSSVMSCSSADLWFVNTHNILWFIPEQTCRPLSRCDEDDWSKPDFCFTSGIS